MLDRFKNKFKGLISKKNKGSGGDLICSIFVIVSLVFFVFYFIGSLDDINTRIRMDQIGRKYILRMESSGSLSNEEITAMKNELKNISNVKKAVDKGNDINITWNNGAGAKGYGQEITLNIDCPAVVTRWGNTSGGASMAEAFRISKSTVIRYKINKQSTAKY